MRCCAVLCRAACCAVLTFSYTPGLIGRSILQQNRGTVVHHEVCTTYQVLVVVLTLTRIIKSVLHIVEPPEMHSQLSSAQPQRAAQLRSVQCGAVPCPAVRFCAVLRCAFFEQHQVSCEVLGTRYHYVHVYPLGTCLLVFLLSSLHVLPLGPLMLVFRIPLIRM